MKENIKKLINGKGPLAENEVKDLLKAYRIPTTKYRVVNKEKDLENEIGYTPRNIPNAVSLSGQARRRR